MGKLYEQFGKLSFSNEAEVSQNFILPLLEHYLGYSTREIIPEKNFPAKDLYSGVNFAPGASKGLTHRPDYVVCIDGDHNKAKFIIDSKGPNEDLTKHIGQLCSYANSVGRNFLMITNGKTLLIYDVNILIFSSKGIKDLQLKFEELKIILGRENQRIKSPVEILKEFNPDKAITKSDQDKIDEVMLSRKILVADFHEYLSSIIKHYDLWHLPTADFHAINNLDIKKVDPNDLLSFKTHIAYGETSRDEKLLKFSQIENQLTLRKRIIVGETGTGKTSLLRYLTLRAAEQAQHYIDTKIPIYIALKEIGHGYNLEQLIVAFLTKHGYRCTNFSDMPASNQFIFFLDAFDEVGEIFRREVCNAINNLSENHDCYVTTRPNALPQLPTSSIFDLLPLSDDKVEAVSRQYMESEYYDFQRQIEENDLIFESRNTLLLLFLISQFKESGKLPDTASKIIKAMVHRVKLWQDQRELHYSELSWEILSEFLSAIAITIFQSNGAVLKLDEAEPVIINIIFELEAKRQIPVGITVSTVISALKQTGMIIANKDHLYFWHRLFLNHFAAGALVKKYSADNTIINSLSIEERWDIIIVAMASSLNEITPVIKGLKKRLWLAAYCLVENSNCEEAEVKMIVKELIKSVDSPVSDVRKKAIAYLQRIDNAQTHKFFLDILENEHYEDVTMMALAAIGRTGSEEAKKIIYAKLNWDTWDFFYWRSSQAYVVEALSHYGEDGYLQIIKNWKKYTNHPLDDACKRIFIRLHNTKNLTQEIIERLQKLYILECKADNSHREKVSALAEILSLVPDEGFAAKVLELPFDHKFEFPKLDSLVEILKSCQSIALVQKIKEKIFLVHPSYHVGKKLTTAIKESAFKIPKEIFYELIKHKDIEVARIALSGLARFPFLEVKQEIDRHLYGVQPQLQSAALQLLVDNVRIISLIRQDQFPSPFFTPTAHTLLDAVRKFHLVEAGPLLYKIQAALGKNNRYEHERPLALALAGTFYHMGETLRQAQVIAWYFNGTGFLQQDKHAHDDLMKNLKQLDPNLASKIAACFYSRYLPSLEDHCYETEVFIETAEELGGQWMVDKVKAIADNYLRLIKIGNKSALHAIERPLRALTKIAKPQDEDWLLSILDKLDDDSSFEFPQLRRAIECLAYIGSQKSLPIIFQIANKNRLCESVMNICHLAYNNICRREHLPITDGNVFK